MKGTVKFFNMSKGFGFITAEDGKDYFVHQSGINPGVNLKDGMDVEFEVVQGDRGPKAEQVKAAEGAEEEEESVEESEE